ncbi:MAG: hypothetical protein RIR26_1266 [Pseudomonadota bacterium]
MEITIQATVRAPLEKVWSAWTTPADITMWNFAAKEWCCPTASIQLKPGGQFSYRMEAKDGSMGFDFAGEFTVVEYLKRIEFQLGDSRSVRVVFRETSEGTLVEETFQAETQNSAERQQQGWQLILNNFKAHVESGT